MEASEVPIVKIHHLDFIYIDVLIVDSALLNPSHCAPSFRYVPPFFTPSISFPIEFMSTSHHP
jgi:hypothetical protein